MGIKNLRVKEKDMVLVKRMITLTSEQDRWIRENHISLSRMMRDLLDREIKKKPPK